MPVLVAPTAFHRMAHPDGEPATARAAAAVGTIMCLSTIATSTPAEVAAAAPEGQRWFQLYVFRDRGVTNSLIDQAAESGYSAIVLTVDAPRLGRRERDLRTGFRVPEDVVVPSVSAAAGGWGGRDAARRARVDRSDAHLGGPRAAGGRLAAAGRSSRGSRPGRTLRSPASTAPPRSSSRTTAAGSSTASRPPRSCCPRRSRRWTGGSRCSSTAASAAAATWSRRSRSAPGRCSSAVRFSGGSPTPASRARAHVLELLRDETELTLALCGCTSPDAVTEAHVRRIGGP